MFSGKTKAPEPLKPVNTAQAQEQTDQERRLRAERGGRGASFLWDAPPIVAGAAKPTVTGG